MVETVPYSLLHLIALYSNDSTNIEVHVLKSGYNQSVNKIPRPIREECRS